MNATLTSPELTRADRCDRCGAAARVRAKLPSGAELLFCQHHANEHEAKLIELAAVLEVSPWRHSTDTPRRPAGQDHLVRNAGLVMNDQSGTGKPSRHHIWHIVRRTLSKSWDDSIFSESAQAAFWCALSLPPLLLGMLGSLAYVAPLFGPETLPTIQEQLISTATRFFSPNVVNEIIAPTVRDIVKGARGEVVSMGFVISLWAGSSAISAFVDSIVEAHDQTPLRHPVRQRFYALGLYVVMLVGRDRDGTVRRARAAQDRRVPARQLGQRAGLRLLPGAVPWSGRGGEHPLSGVAAQTAAVASAAHSARCWRPSCFCSPRSGCGCI